MLRRLCLLAATLAALAAHAQAPVDEVRVHKNERKLMLLADGKVVQTFHIALGRNPVGPKQKMGDKKTPEGRYVLDYKKADSAYYKAIHISYPSAEDIARAQRSKVNPGGMVMIHGQKNGYQRYETFTQRHDWTDGCIALTNEDMDTVWKAVAPGTPIEILP